MTTCRIYVACLASYNSGELHGRWIDCNDTTADELQDEVNAILRASRYPNVLVEYAGKMVPSAEEFAIHDHEGFGRMVGEYTSLTDVAAMAEALDGDNALGFRFLIENNGASIESASENASEVMWTLERPVEAVATFFEETGQLAELPEWARNNINWAGIARDWEAGGDLTTFSDPDEGEVTILNANSF